MDREELNQIYTASVRIAAAARSYVKVKNLHLDNPDRIANDLHEAWKELQLAVGVEPVDRTNSDE